MSRQASALIEDDIIGIAKRSAASSLYHHR